MRGGGMASERRFYLVAAVVLAFGLGNSLITRHMDWIDCVSNRVDSLVSQVSDRASEGEIRVEGLSETACNRGGQRIERGRDALAKAQMKLTCAQRAIAIHQADNVREQVEKARALTLDQLQQSFIIQQHKIEVPKTSKRRNIPSDDTI
jgi:hypothetical protein